MNSLFMDILQAIRSEFNKPMIITSGFRSRNHSVEKHKTSFGEHTLGVAADILCNGQDAIRLIELAFNHQLRRVGLNQKGDHNQRFIHLGIGNIILPMRFKAAIWTY